MTDYAASSVHFSIVIRADALVERGVDRGELLKLFEVEAPQGEVSGLMSFGPHQGVEISDGLCAQLEAFGLLYVDDYFVFAPEVPDWCAFGARLIAPDGYN
jgi:hypothetical protein